MVSAPPFHTSPLRAGAWHACEHPERRYDERVVWTGPCRACRLHMAATLHNNPAESATFVTILANGEAIIDNRTLAHVALRCAEQHDDPLLAREARRAVERFNG